MERAALSGAIEEFVEKRTGRPARVFSIESLSGGTGQDNFRVDVQIGDDPPRPMVLRSDARTSLPGSLTRRAEFVIIQTAVMARVKTPAAHWLCEDLVRPMSSAFFLEWAPGEAEARQILRAPELAGARQALTEQLAAELAKIHAITPAAASHLNMELPGDPAAAALRHHRNALDQIPEPHPAIELALRWLSDNRPSPRPIALCHGDFSTRNLVVGSDGLSAILDWEFAHWGDPIDDLGWFCVRAGRLGEVEHPAGGIASREAFYAAYGEASGIPVASKDVFYWELMGNVRWAIGALHQGERYMSGAEDDIELLAQSRRVTEVEYELLRMLAQAPGGYGGRT